MQYTRHTRYGSYTCEATKRAAAVIAAAAVDAEVSISFDFRGCWPSPRDLSTVWASPRRRHEGQTWPRVEARSPVAKDRGCQGWLARCRLTFRRCVVACHRCRRSSCSRETSSRYLAAQILQIDRKLFKQFISFLFN